MKRIVAIIIIHFGIVLLSSAQRVGLEVLDDNSYLIGFKVYCENLIERTCLTKSTLDITINDVMDVASLVHPADSFEYNLLYAYRNDLELRRNQLSNIDIFIADTLLSECKNPFHCSVYSFQRDSFCVVGYDERDSVDLLDYADFNDLILPNRDSTEISWNHIFCYEPSVGVRKICDCSTPFCRDDSLLFCKACADACSKFHLSRISFVSSLNVMGNKSFDDFLNFFAPIQLPFYVNESYVLSQSIENHSVLPKELQEKFLHHVGYEADIVPIGFIEFDECYLTISKQNPGDFRYDWIIASYDRRGSMLSHIILKDQYVENSFVIMPDGHILFMQYDYPECAYEVSNDGHIKAMFTNGKRRQRTPDLPSRDSGPSVFRSFGKDVSEHLSFVDFFVNHTKSMSCPLVIKDSQILSQSGECVAIPHNIARALPRQIRKGNLVAVGYVWIGRCFVALARNTSCSKWYVVTINAESQELYCLVLRARGVEDSFILQPDGHIVFMYYTYPGYQFCIGPHGAITSLHSRRAVTRSGYVSDYP